MNESKNWAVGLLVLVVIALGGGLWLLRSGSAPEDNTGAVGGLGDKPRVLNQLVVNDQFPGAIVYVSSVTLADGGWVVVKNETGQIIGTQYFNQGTDTGVVNLSELTKEGSYYLATLYGDNGDKVFDPAADLPLRDSADQEILIRFLATQNLPEVKG